VAILKSEGNQGGDEASGWENRGELTTSWVVVC